MRDRVGNDVAVALTDDADLSALVIDRGHNGYGVGTLRSFPPVDLFLDGHGSMMTSDALIPARSLDINPTFGRHTLARIYLPADVP